MIIDPRKAAFNPSALIAAGQKRDKFIPIVGGMLVVTLPGESMRCPVESVIDNDTVIVKIDRPPISRMHIFRFEESVGVRRRTKDGREWWEAQTERDFVAEQKRLYEAANPPKQAKTTKPKRKPRRAKAG